MCLIVEPGIQAVRVDTEVQCQWLVVGAFRVSGKLLVLIRAYLVPSEDIDDKLEGLARCVASGRRYGRVLICMDANASSMAWGADHQDVRGIRVVEMLSRLHLYSKNDANSPPTFRN